MPRIDVKALHRIMMGRNFLFKFQLANAVGMSYERLTAIIVTGEDEVEEEELSRLCSGLGCERSDLVAGEQESAPGVEGAGEGNTREI